MNPLQWVNKQVRIETYLGSNLPLEKIPFVGRGRSELAVESLAFYLRENLLQGLSMPPSWSYDKGKGVELIDPFLEDEQSWILGGMLSHMGPVHDWRTVFTFFRAHGEVKLNMRIPWIHQTQTRLWPLHLLRQLKALVRNSNFTPEPLVL